VLYDPKHQVPLTPTPWNESTARQTIAEIVADTEASFDRESFWPTHPWDDAQGILKGLYFGAAGTIWALRYLAEKRGTRTHLDLADSIDRVCAKFVAEDDSRTAGSFLINEVGILLVHWHITRDRAAADRLFELIAGNAELPTDELMWGTPGTALAASFMWENTSEQRWRDLFVKKIAELWSRWKYRPEQRAFLRRQRLYQPEPRIFLGPVHGFAGNASVLMRGTTLMGEQRREEMYLRIAGAIRGTANIEGNFANWLGLASSPSGDAPLSGSDDYPWLVQWCHGAPGTLGALSALPKDTDPEVESLFLVAADNPAIPAPAMSAFLGFGMGSLRDSS
jgi:Lanthionine synthetase C-like protein